LALSVGVVVVLVAAVMVLAAGSEGGWLWAAVTSRVFLTAGGVFVACLVLSVPLVSVLWQAGRANREARRAPCRGRLARVGRSIGLNAVERQAYFVAPRGRDARDTGLWNAQRGRDARDTVGDRGAAIVEFTLVLPILLMLGMVMAQSALLMAGNVVVHYAAHGAARTAVVMVPLDFTDEIFTQREDTFREPGGNAPRNVLPESGVKVTRIREAALWAVTPISCGNRQIPAADCEAVRRGIEAHWAAYNQPRPGWLDSLPHRRQYAMDHTTVTVRPPEETDPDTGLPTYGEHEDVVVEVSHVFYMGVPYAGRLLSALFGEDGRTLSDPPGGFGVEIHATGRLPNQGAQDFIEKERFQDWQGR